MDTEDIAADADLTVVEPRRLPIRRLRHGRGFRYLLDGDPVSATRRARIEALAIPPAWTDVVIASTTDAHVLASGIDDDGRTQYLYHPDFRAAADRLKFARLAELTSRLPRLRSAVADAIEAREDGASDLAAIIGLIDVTAIRVGSARYAEERGTIGASTLRRRHVSVDDPLVRLTYTAKGGIDRDLQFAERSLARFLDRRRRTLRSDDQHVFTGPEGGTITGGAIGRSLSAWSGMDMTAKELRTWSATATMVAALMDPDVDRAPERSDDPVLAAYDDVAEHLGNTRAVARSSYVAPIVVEAYEDGRLEDEWKRSRRSSIFSRSEQTLRKLLVGG